MGIEDPQISIDRQMLYSYPTRPSLDRASEQHAETQGCESARSEWTRSCDKSEEGVFLNNASRWLLT